MWKFYDKASYSLTWSLSFFFPLDNFVFYRTTVLSTYKEWIFHDVEIFAHVGLFSTCMGWEKTSELWVGWRYCDVNVVSHAVVIQVGNVWSMTVRLWPPDTCQHWRVPHRFIRTFFSLGNILAYICRVWMELQYYPIACLHSFEQLYCSKYLFTSGPDQQDVVIKMKTEMDVLKWILLN